MLTITPTAETVIRDLLEASPLPDGSGVRIASDPETGDGYEFALSLVEQPEPDDRIVDDASVLVFIEPVAAPLLDESVLDASSAGGAITFTVEPKVV